MQPAQRALLFPAALLSAALMRCAFAPLDWGWIAWVGLAPLFYILPAARRTRHAFGLGYLYGCVGWGGTITWIGTTVTNWSGSPIGWVAWILLTLIKSLWFGLFGVLAWWIARKSTGRLRIVGFASAWTLVEWLRGQTAIAMPWALIGYAQHKYLPVIQAADLGGVYLISFAIAMMNAGVAEAFRRSGVQAFRAEETAGRRQEAVNGRTAEDGDEDEPNHLASLSPTPPLPLSPSQCLFLPVILLVLLLDYGYIALNRTYEGPAVRLALMQPNVRSDRAVAGQDERDLAAYAVMAERVASSQPLVLIWPESTAPQDAVNDPRTRNGFAVMARTLGVWVLVGTNYIDEQHHPYNSAALFAPDGNLANRYDKQWLVPMGEWIVGRRWLPFGDLFHFPKEDIVSGTSEQPLAIGPIRMAPLICYESVFPIMPRNRVNHGANLLVNITNDSWAGESSELEQHFAMTVLRAVETRRYTATAATTGITALIEPTGKVRAIPPYRADSLVVQPLLLDGRSLYTQFGDWVVSLSAVFCGLMLVFSRIRPAEK